MKYAIVTFGCRVNQADSLQIERDLLARGGIGVPSSEAELVIVNTCSVTATADQGARQVVRRIARENPDARIVVTGCYATRRPDEIAALPGVVRVIRNDDKPGIMAALGEDGWLTTAVRFGAGDGACGGAIEPGVAGRTAFTLRVQTGCDQECSYCIIPKTRGIGRSATIDAVLRDIQRAANAGFKEIALAGVHLGSYGIDLEPRASLLDLLRAIDRLDLDVTFRVSSLEPMDCTRGIVELVAASGGRFAPHFHLPLQHASDSILARMRRPYTLDYYRRLVDGIVDRLPHAAIGSDMIVGFPGETDADFARNLEYLPGAPLSHLHVFPYSDRPGTEASAMPDKVAGPLVRDRAAALRAVGAAVSTRFKASQVGTIRPGLTLEDGSLVVTDNYLKVRIAPGLNRNERVAVRLDTGGTGVVCALAESPDSYRDDIAIASR
jgi:threonylcarbamoyladenosine tRNA methylthiotransferase MtaB